MAVAALTSCTELQLGPHHVWWLCVGLGCFTWCALTAVGFRRFGIARSHIPLMAFVFLLAGFWGAHAARAIEAVGLEAVVSHPGLLRQVRGNNVIGAWVVGLPVVCIYCWTWRLRVLQVLDALAPGLAAAYGMGRVGCHLIGDGCYGVVTDGPWGVSYPGGLVPTTEMVHPTSLYEALASLAVLVSLARLGSRREGVIFQVYLVLFGVTRFLVEFIRRNESLHGLSQAQWISLGLVLVACLVWSRQPHAAESPVAR